MWCFHLTFMSMVPSGKQGVRHSTSGAMPSCHFEEWSTRRAGDASGEL